MQKEDNRIEEQEGELKECLHELHAVLREDPLNEEVQQVCICLLFDSVLVLFLCSLLLSCLCVCVGGRWMMISLFLYQLFVYTYTLRVDTVSCV